MSPQRPYALWRRAGDFVIVSGQLGVVPGSETMALAEGGAAAQLRQALANQAAILHEAGASLADVVKASLFLVDMEDYPACNEVWVETFHDPLPTRTTVVVTALPYEALVEVEAWAYSPATR